MRGDGMIKQILGYYANGETIYDFEPGMICTAAFILCSQCTAPIRAMGGPAYGSLCILCHNTKIKESNT